MTVIKEIEGKTALLIPHAPFLVGETFTEALCINQHRLTTTINTTKIRMPLTQ